MLGHRGRAALRGGRRWQDPVNLRVLDARLIDRHRHQRDALVAQVGQPVPAVADAHLPIGLDRHVRRFQAGRRLQEVAHPLVAALDAAHVGAAALADVVAGVLLPGRVEVGEVHQDHRLLRAARLRAHRHRHVVVAEAELRQLALAHLPAGDRPQARDAQADAGRAEGGVARLVVRDERLRPGLVRQGRPEHPGDRAERRRLPAPARPRPSRSVNDPSAAAPSSPARARPPERSPRPPRSAWVPPAMIAPGRSS